jgi:Fe-S-cluster containining protein
MPSLCDQCAALCCRYISLPIDNPTTRKDYDDIRWYIIHQNVVVYIEKKQWYVGILNRCKHLQDDNRCGIYETRPRICRKYTTDNCDYHGGEYDFEQLFTSAEHLMAYAETTLAKARAKKRATVNRRRVDKKLRKPSRPNVMPANAGSVARPRVSLTVKGRVPLPLTK